MDVDGNLRDAEPYEGQEYHRVIGVIREHDRNPIAGLEAESREAVRQTVDPIVKVGERDADAVEEAEGLCSVVSRAARQQLRDRIHGATVASFLSLAC